MKFGLLPALFFMLASPISAFAGYLANGQQLRVGQYLYSDNNKYYAVMQTDGNFVVYRNDSTMHAVWSTNTTGLGATFAVMQTDGNFVLYKDNYIPVWASNTTGSNAYFSIDTNGRAFVAENYVAWASNTSDHSVPTGPVEAEGQTAIIFPSGTSFPPGQSYYQGVYRFTFQTDGNLVLYENTGGGDVAIWHPNLKKLGGDMANVDNQAVNVWRSDDEMYWSSIWDEQSQSAPNNLKGVGAAFLAFQVDGNLVLYVPGYIWAASKSDAPSGNSGPNCYGPPASCIGSTIPVISFPW